MINHNNKQKNNTFHIYISVSNVVTLSCDNTLIFVYFTQNLLENWILDNLVVNKTLRKLRKATTSRDNDICYNCYPIVSWARQSLCNTVTVSRSARAKAEQKSAQ